MHIRRFDIAVAGAGLVGASFALAQRGSGLSLALLGPLPDRAPAASAAASVPWDTRIYALSPGSVEYLSAIGVWSRMDPARRQPCLGMEVAGDALGGRISFSAFDAGVPALAYMVESTALARPMTELLRALPDTTLIGAPLLDATREGDGWRIQLADGEVVDASLLVGADGAESAVRRIAGLKADMFDYRQQAVVANYRIERPHGGIAFQWFRHPDVLAYLPLPGAHMSMVWSLPDERAAALRAMTPDELADEAGTAGQHRLGRLTPLNKPAAFPLNALRVPRITGDKVALMGDAAHTVHPLAGLGVNLGFRDARALADAVRRREVFRGCGDPRVLARYARARSEDILAVQTFTHAMQRLFASSWPAASTFRNLGMNLVDRLPVIKGQLMRRALTS